MSKIWPYSSLTQAPTNLKEAIDWVLRVTGKDGKKNDKTAASPPQFGCLCFLAKAVKDLLYDARSPGTPGPTSGRYWDDILLDQEKDIVKPVLQDLGLVNSTSASTTSTCAGGTEVIKTLIDQLALGLQKWVGWQEGEEDKCCLKGTNGIGKKCDCPGGGGNCCGTGGSGTTCHECSTCGTSANGDTANKCYLSAYCKKNSTSSGGSPTEGDYYWPTISSDSTKVHLLARIFLGSVCLIWSGLSQLGFLTGGSKRWEEGVLSKEGDGLGSFMAAMGYDLERLNQTGKAGTFVNGLLKGSGAKGIQWKEFTGDSTGKDSVAEYYSSIYGAAQSAAKGSAKSTESICKDYPLLVLHILASGYFRAGSAGAKGITSPAKPATSPTSATPSPRKPRTIREILYWLSALPYSQGYCGLVGRMKGKMDGILPKEEQDKGELKLHSESTKASTTLKRDDITHYLMAACGYCPLVLIGIQGTIEREVDNAGTQASGSPGVGVPGVGVPGVGVPGVGVPGAVSPAAAGADQKKCPKHKDNRSHRCDPKDIKTEQAAPASAAPAAPAPPTGKPLEKGQVCYGGYHLEVSSFGPLHGMYANGLFGFQMDMSSAQCLDQLRVYVYHCFYQLYFLRKQCSTGVEVGVAGGVGGAKTVLGWNSCRYGSGVSGSGAKIWICETKGSSGAGDHTKNCGLQSGAGSTSVSALQGFLCDAIGTMACNQTIGVDLNSRKQSYPDIEEHMNKIVTPSGEVKGPHKEYPELCPVPMGWDKDNHFKDLTKGTHKTAELEKGTDKYPAHCTGNTLSHLLEYYCDPKQCHGSLVVLLRLLACITPTVPRTLGDLFGFYYYIVYIGGNSKGGGAGEKVHEKLKGLEGDVRLGMKGIGNNGDAVVEALTTWNNSGICSGGKEGHLKCLTECANGGPYLSPLSGQQYGQLSPAMAGTYLSWLVYLIEGFQEGLEELKDDYMKVDCKGDGCTGPAGAVGCGESCKAGSHGMPCSGGGSNGVCQCTSVVSCTGVLPVLYKYGFGYGNVEALHDTAGGTPKKCDAFLTTLKGVLKGEHIKHNGSGLHHEINQLIYTTRLPWIFVLTLAWLVAVLYLAFGAIWPLDWTHMRSHCRGWFRKGSLSPWEVLMVGKMKGRGILEFFGGR